MSKIAALAPQLPASLALAGASTMIDAAGRRRVQKDQDAANQTWLDFQRRRKAIAAGEEEAGRAKATTAFSENLDANTQENRENLIDTEAARLEADYASGLPALSQEVIGSGQDAGRSEVFDTAMARSLAEATAEARKRIQGLARSSAYGGGTQYGQGQVLGDRFRDASEDIGFANDSRRGSAASLQRYQTVEPEMLEYKQSPLVPLLQAGSMVVGAMDPSKLSGLFGGAGGAVKSSLRPTPRPVSAPAQFSFMPQMSAYTPTMGGGLPGPR